MAEQSASHDDTAEQLKSARRDRYGAIILCGGKGTRLVGITGDEVPKALYKLDGRELVTYSIDLVSHGAVDKALFAIKHLPEQMESWFSSLKLPFDSMLMTVRSNSTADAISEGMAMIERNQVIICSCDEIIRNLNLMDMIRHHEQTGSLLTVLATDSAKATGDGVLLGVEGGRVTRILEKKDAEPGESEGMLYHAGIIIIRQEALEYLNLQDYRKGRVVDMPVMRGGLRAGILNAYTDRNVVFFNINTPKDARKAAAHMKMCSA
jgi:NDP-sugar pyrophosphorylase family protein